MQGRTCTSVLLALAVLLITSSAHALEPENRIRQIMRKAEILEQQHKFDQAIVLYESMIREYPEEKFDNEISSGRYGDMAQDHIRSLKCQKSKSYFTAQDPQRLGGVVKEAIAKRSKEDLIKFAACGFTVGAIDSDNTWLLLPQEVVPVILQAAEGFDFSSGRITQLLEDRWNLEFSGRDKKDRFIFQFVRKKPKSWIWDYFATSSDALLDILFAAKSRAK